jgi:uncharacterized membrane protein
MGMQIYRKGKRPVTPLAGPYGHPFHPMLVTVPIGAWVTSLVFDIASHTADEYEVFVKGAFWLIGIGILGAVLAAVFGLLDLLAIPPGTKAFKTALAHMALNLVAVGVFAVSFAVRRGDLDEDYVDTLPLVLSIVGLAIVAVSGWLGGRLAYRYGVRVADEEAQAEAFVP